MEILLIWRNSLLKAQKNTVMRYFVLIVLLNKWNLVVLATDVE